MKNKSKNITKKNKKVFWQPGMVRASHILFLLDEELTESEITQKEIKAEKVLEKIREGVGFPELAKAYSEDGSAGSGGDLGVLERGKMVPEIEQIVFSMKEGEVSDIVRSPYGLHIIKVNEVSLGRSQPLDEVRDKIIGELRQKRFKKAFESYVANLKKNAFIENYLKIEIAKLSDESTAVRKKPKSRAEIKRKVANILPPLKRNSASQKTQPETQASPPVALEENFENLGVPSDLHFMERKLMKIKEMREGNVISEEDYQRRKREILDGL